MILLQKLKIQKPENSLNLEYNTSNAFSPTYLWKMATYIVWFTFCFHAITFLEVEEWDIYWKICLFWFAGITLLFVVLDRLKEAQTVVLFTHHTYDNGEKVFVKATGLYPLTPEVHLTVELHVNLIPKAWVELPETEQGLYDWVIKQPEFIKLSDELKLNYNYINYTVVPTRYTGLIYNG